MNLPNPKHELEELFPNKTFVDASKLSTPLMSWVEVATRPSMPGLGGRNADGVNWFPVAMLIAKLNWACRRGSCWWTSIQKSWDPTAISFGNRSIKKKQKNSPPGWLGPTENLSDKSTHQEDKRWIHERHKEVRRTKVGYRRRGPWPPADSDWLATGNYD